MTSKPHSLARYGWLSLVTALVTIVMKGAAYRLTGSVGLLSDALESVVNVAAAVVALLILAYSRRPPDARHHFGHGKAEYFASSFEGTMILLAAVSIGVAAWDRLQHPAVLKALDLGLPISASAAVINGLVAFVLLRAGRRYGSIVLEADGKHLLTDVWTSVGVIGGLLAARVTGWPVMDPILALLVAVNILWSGIGLLRRSFDGFLDAALQQDESVAIESVLERFRRRGIGFHELRTRRSGVQRFMDVHVLVPGDTTVRAGHDLLEEIEQALREVVPELAVTTHLEPCEDPRSFEHRVPGYAETGLSAGHDEPVARARAAPDPLRAARHEAPAFSGTGFAKAELAAVSGWLLLIPGTVLSMLFTGPYVDLALGAALAGFSILLISLRRGR